MEARRPGKHGLGQDPGLEPGEWCAEAEMNTRTESDVVSGLAVEVEAVRVGLDLTVHFSFRRESFTRIEVV